MDDSSQTLSQAQHVVDQWIEQWEEGYFHPLSNLARLTEEVGELARELNHQYGDKPPKDSSPPKALEQELGDILFVVITLANSLDVELDDALETVLEKYDIRDADRFTARDESDETNLQ